MWWEYLSKWFINVTINFYKSMLFQAYFVFKDFLRALVLFGTRTHPNFGLLLIYVMGFKTRLDSFACVPCCLRMIDSTDPLTVTPADLLVTLAIWSLFMTLQRIESCGQKRTLNSQVIAAPTKNYFGLLKIVHRGPELI